MADFLDREVDFVGDAHGEARQIVPVGGEHDPPWRDAELAVPHTASPIHSAARLACLLCLTLTGSSPYVRGNLPPHHGRGAGK